MVQALVEAGKVEAKRVREHRQGHPQARGAGQHGHRPRRGRPAHQAPQRRSPGGHGGRQQRRGSISPASTARASTCSSSDFAPRPPRRSPAGLGKHLAATPRRHLLPLPQAGQDARRTSSNCWTRPTTTSSAREPSPPERPSRRQAMSETAVTRTVLVANRRGASCPRRRR